MIKSQAPDHIVERNVVGINRDDDSICSLRLIGTVVRITKGIESITLKVIANQQVSCDEQE